MMCLCPTAITGFCIRLKEMYDQRWTPQNLSAKYARPQLTNADKYGLSDAYVFDGSYFRNQANSVGIIPSQNNGQRRS